MGYITIAILGRAEGLLHFRCNLELTKCVDATVPLGVPLDNGDEGSNPSPVPHVDEGLRHVGYQGGPKGHTSRGTVSCQRPLQY